MTAFIRLLPVKSSRTSTHAVIVPTTALTAATRSDAPSVSFSAATASGAVTADQNACRPWLPDDQTSAAIGRRTTTERKVVTNPSASGAPERGRRLAADRGSAVLASGRASDRLLDLRHAALRRVEPHLVGPAPPAEVPVVDPEDARPRREPVGVLREHLPVDGPEAVLGEQLLRRRALDEPDEGVRDVLAGRALEDGDRQLDQHRLARDHVLQVLAGLPRRLRLALVGDEHVALAREEGVRRVAAGGVLRDDVPEELLHVGGRLRVGLAEAALRAVGGEDVPLGRARAERVRRHDLDARPDEVGPPLDVLRVAVSDGEDDDGVGGDPAVGLAAPVRVDEALVDEQVHVVAGREEDDVGPEAVRDRARLVGRRAVGLAERDALPGGGLLERLDDLPQHGLRGGVGDEGED